MYKTEQNSVNQIKMSYYEDRKQSLFGVVYLILQS